jgi:hypothetical protein
MPKRLAVPADEIHNGLCFICDSESRVLPSGQKPRTILVQCIKCKKIFDVLLLHFMRNRAACECEIKRHGDIGTHLHTMWRGMINRCKPSYFQRQYYFDKGITVCEEWRDYRKFKKWALHNGYSPALQIDRRENDQGYNPANCRFVTQEYNLSNRDCTVMVNYHGCCTALSILCGGSDNSKYYLALRRIKKGWNHERAIDTPAREGNYKRRQTS